MGQNLPFESRAFVIHVREDSREARFIPDRPNAPKYSPKVAYPMGPQKR
jgi:hypothetical protein